MVEYFTVEEAGFNPRLVADGVKLTFGHIEAALARLMFVADHKRATFVSRLKQWQKMGFPSVSRVGRGARADYELSHLLQLAIMMQLLRIGLTPDRAIKYTNQCWPELRLGFIEAFELLAQNAPVISYCVVSMNALSELEGLSWEMSARADIIRDAELAGLWLGIDADEGEHEGAREATDRGYSSEAWKEQVRSSLACSVIIEMTKLCMGIVVAVRSVSGWTLDCFRRDFIQWKAEHADWYDKVGRARDHADLAELRRYTASPTMREKLLPLAQGHARALTGLEVRDGDPEA